ncbi:hypothetical protein H0266_10770 [Halobacillus locisalis]|uniref:Uncharacterized protein n=1 Tax=Halobacillus locisalis TaxID=220753 RepID=A0A838CUU2_9BACI|nr:hypothetical protein [Halobacillus locisalis]MBA2175376.1 hypothetical protein [Halobacillus locisalis]
MKPKYYDGTVIGETLNLYRDYNIIESYLINVIEEKPIGARDLLEFESKELYNAEDLLLAVISEMGGHNGHYHTVIASTELDDFLHKKLSTHEIVQFIEDVIRDDETNDSSTNTISMDIAIQSAISDLRAFKKEMTGAITSLSGIEDEIVPFIHFDNIIKELSDLYMEINH